MEIPSKVVVSKWYTCANDPLICICLLMCKIDVKSSCALPAQFIQEFTNFIESQRAKGIGIELGIETSLNPKVHATSASIDPVSYKHIPS